MRLAGSQGAGVVHPMCACCDACCLTAALQQSVHHKGLSGGMSEPAAAHYLPCVMCGPALAVYLAGTRALGMLLVLIQR